MTLMTGFVVQGHTLYIYCIYIYSIYIYVYIYIYIRTVYSGIYNPKSEKVGTVWKTQIKKESSDF